MASVYQLQSLQIQVFQPPNFEPRPYPSVSPFVQLELTIFVERRFIRHYSSINQFGDPGAPFLSQETLRFDLHLLRERNRVAGIVGPMLSRLLFMPNSSVLEDVLNAIIQEGAALVNCMPSRGRTVLPLHANLRETVVEHVNYDENEVLARTVAESVLEFERRNYDGMVPAKRVGVDSGESSATNQDCAICLESLEDGSMTSELPCFHTFHQNCIEEWRKVKHNCPLCRSELPA